MNALLKECFSFVSSSPIKAIHTKPARLYEDDALFAFFGAFPFQNQVGFVSRDLDAHVLGFWGLGNFLSRSFQTETETEKGLNDFEKTLLKGQRAWVSIAFSEDERSPYPLARAWIPNLSYTKTQQGVFWSLSLKSQKEKEKLLEALQYFKTENKKPQEKFQNIDEKKEAFLLALEQAKKMLSSSLSKVVLAHQSTLEGSFSFSPLSFMASLKAKGAYRLALLQEDTQVLFGLPPERLFLRKNNNIFTEALAGTQAKGDGDRVHQTNLLQNAHYQKEHDFVVQEIQKRLSSFGSLEIGQKSIKELPSLLHLHTKISLKSSQAPLGTLWHAMHRTPAVCGTPNQKALAFIKQQEQFFRGLYAGASGHFSNEDSELCVPLRVGYGMREKKHYALSCFSGVGLISGFSSYKEYQEALNKRAWLDLKL